MPVKCAISIYLATCIAAHRKAAFLEAQRTTRSTACPTAMFTARHQTTCTAAHRTKYTAAQRTTCSIAHRISNGTATCTAAHRTATLLEAQRTACTAACLTSTCTEEIKAWCITHAAALRLTRSGRDGWLGISGARQVPKSIFTQYRWLGLGVSRHRSNRLIQPSAPYDSAPASVSADAVV